VTARIPLLQPAGKHDGKQGAGDDAELALLGNGAGEDPIGYPNSHPALNNDRGCHRSTQRGQASA
jgi:hypothetical protein